MITAAHNLAAMGYRVHPVHGIRADGTCTCGLGAKCRTAGKHPMFGDWASVATMDAAVVSSWNWDGMNLGVVPGGDFTILDFDGPEGLSLLRRMSSILPELPDDTPIVQTGSGGIHVYIRGVAKSRIRLLPGFDIRGVGGQAVVPPSQHYSGNTYAWLNPPAGPPPHAPKWLAVAQGEVPDELRPSEMVEEGDLRRLTEKGRLAGAFRALLAGEPFAPAGQRNGTMASMCGAIARRWPFCDPEQVADFFTNSLATMERAGEGAPTRDQVVGALARFSNMQREELQRRPRIFVTTDIEGMADEAIEALATKAIDMGIFTRGGQLTRVRPNENLPGGVLRGELPHAFETLAPANLVAHLSSIAQWVKRKVDGDVSPQYPPPPVIARIDQRGSWPGIPHAERIVDGMTLRPDGSLFRGGGYDEVTGTIAMGHADSHPVMSVQEAIHALDSVVVDFPFSSPAHYSAWMASILTSVGQAVFRGPSPLFLIDANVRGAGKTLLAETSILIASGRSATRAALGRDNDEDRKQITSMAMNGATCILIDNISGLFGTPKLCEALSLHDSGWSDRILGKSKNWSGPFKPTWWATGNNIRLQPDVARRVCYIRLASPFEKPELRQGFVQPSLMSWVQENRAMLYRAAVSLLHHYIMAGKPQKDLEPWGTFEGWSELIRQCLVWASLPDPAETREELGVADEEQDLASKLLEGLQELGLERFSPTDVCNMLYGPAPTLADTQKYELLREALDEGCIQRQLNPTPQSVGRLFSRFRERVADGLRLRRLPGKGSQWRVEVMSK